MRGNTIDKSIQMNYDFLWDTIDFLIKNPKRVYSREQLLNSVWGDDIYVESRTIDVHIRRLRKAINIDGKKDLIRTVRSAGYSLDSWRSFGFINDINFPLTFDNFSQSLKLKLTSATAAVGNFLFKLRNPELTVKDMAESVVREVVGQRDLQFLLKKLNSLKLIF